MEEVQSYKKKIKQLEDDLLFRLSNSQVPTLRCTAACLHSIQPRFSLASNQLPDISRPCCALILQR